MIQRKVARIQQCHIWNSGSNKIPYKRSDIKQRLDTEYGNSSPSITTLKLDPSCFTIAWSWSTSRWVCNRDNILNVPLVEEVTLKDCHLKKRTATQTRPSKICILQILHCHLVMSKISGQWAPRIIGDLQKQRWVQSCIAHLELQNLQEALTCIVTAVDIIFYHDSLSKRDSMEWP